MTRLRSVRAVRHYLRRMKEWIRVLGCMGVRELYAFIWGMTAWRGMRVKAIQWHLRGLDKSDFYNLIEYYRRGTARQKCEFCPGDPDIREVMDNIIKCMELDTDIKEK